MPPRSRLRAFLATLALIAASGCAEGGNSLDPGPFKVAMHLPSDLLGNWSGPGASAVLLCRPDLVITATGPGHATWTGGRSRFTAPYGTYDTVLTLDDVLFIVGAPGISSGQTITVPLPKAGYADYHYRLTLEYVVDGAGKAGESSAEFFCEGYKA